jgi:SPP1 gp7 family putative phage head morphogenesis protein
VPLAHHHPGKRTAVLANLLRSVAGWRMRRRRGPLPRQAQPDLIRAEYGKAIIRLAVEPARRALGAEWQSLARALEDRRRALGKMDAAGDEGSRLVDRAARRAANAFRPRELEEVATRFGRRTSDFQQHQLDRQVRAAIGVPLDAIERPIAAHIETFAAVNVDLIKTLPDRYFDRVRADVLDAFEHGTSIDVLAQQIADDFDATESDAMRIARDQIGKLAGQVNQARQEALGVESYIWRTMHDERVRDEHAERDGQQFDWSDPPEDGHPGEPIQCLPGDARVLLHAPAVRAYRRWHRGELTTIVARDCEPLRVTPNHPVLTLRGWLPAHLVQVGDYLVEAPDQCLDFSVGDPDRRDATAEQLFGALSQFGESHWIYALRDGFHGDAAFYEEVDVVSIDRSLLLAATAWLDVVAKQNLADGRASATQALGDLLLAHAVQVRSNDFRFRQVQRTATSEWEGTVYNFETVTNWFSSHGLIIHNCRCYAEPVFDDIVEATEEE